MNPDPLAREPLCPESIQEIITRQDEDLQKLEGGVFDPIAVTPPVHTDQYDALRYDALRFQIRETELLYFRMKRQLQSMHVPGGKIFIPAPNEYRCQTCYNEDCEFHPNWKVKDYMATSIRNFTALNGCLAWLPPKEE